MMKVQALTVRAEVLAQNISILICLSFPQVVMIQLCLVLSGLSVGICADREFVPLFGRAPKSLTDAFPFSLQEDDQHHGHDLDQHRGHDLSIDNDLGPDRDQRQVTGEGEIREMNLSLSIISE